MLLKLVMFLAIIHISEEINSLSQSLNSIVVGVGNVVGVVCITVVSEQLGVFRFLVLLGKEMLLYFLRQCGLVSDIRLYPKHVQICDSLQRVNVPYL